MVRNGCVMLYRKSQKDEIRALAAAGGVETRPDKKWLTVAQLRGTLVKVLAPSREVGCVKNGF